MFLGETSTRDGVVAGVAKNEEHRTNVKAMLDDYYSDCLEISGPAIPMVNLISSNENEYIMG